MGTSTDLKTKRAASLQAATNIITKAKAEDRDLTASEVTRIEAQHAEVEDFDKKLKGVALVDSVMSLGSADGSYSGSGSLRLAMTGRFAKSLASTIADKITRPSGPGGRKALVVGSVTLDPSAGVEHVADPSIIPRLPTSILDCLELVPRISPSFTYPRSTD